MTLVIKDPGQCCGSLTMYELDSWCCSGYDISKDLEKLDSLMVKAYKANISYGWDEDRERPDLSSTGSFEYNLGVIAEDYEGDFLIHCIVTDDQLETPKVKAILKRYNFKFVTKWVNLNSENVCNLFVRHIDIEDEDSQTCNVELDYDYILKRSSTS